MVSRVPKHDNQANHEATWPTIHKRPTELFNQRITVIITIAPSSPRASVAALARRVLPFRRLLRIDENRVYQRL